jgi:hypothetical protein
MFGSKAFGPTYVLDDDERWKGAQLLDAKKGIFWGKYGRMAKLVAAPDLGSGELAHEGSNPSLPKK